jgi:hypothetical protein
MDKPNKEQWATDGKRKLLLEWLIDGCWDAMKCDDPKEPNATEYEGYDGFYNNLARPDLGAVGM